MWTQELTTCLEDLLFSCKALHEKQMFTNVLWQQNNTGDFMQSKIHTVHSRLYISPTLDVTLELKINENKWKHWGSCKNIIRFEVV